MTRFLIAAVLITSLVIFFSGTSAVVSTPPAMAALYQNQCTDSLMGGTSGWWDPDNDVKMEWYRLENTGIDIVGAMFNNAMRYSANIIYEWWEYRRANGSVEFSLFRCQIQNGAYWDGWVRSSR